MWYALWGDLSFAKECTPALECVDDWVGLAHLGLTVWSTEWGWPTIILRWIYGQRDSLQLGGGLYAFCQVALDWRSTGAGGKKSHNAPMTPLPP